MNRLGALAVVCIGACTASSNQGNAADLASNVDLAQGPVDAAMARDLTPTLPDGGLCGAVASGTCNNCLKGSCCAPLLACRAEATCAACIQDPGGGACAGDLRFTRLQECATATCPSPCPALQRPSPSPCPGPNSADGQTCQTAGQYIGLCSTIFDPEEVDCCQTCEPSTQAGCPLVVKSHCCKLQGACGGVNMAPCCAGLYCQAGSCASCYTVGTTCSGGATCCDGLTCSGGFCRAPEGGACSQDSDCISPLLCIQHQCSTPLPADFPCTRDVECQSGYCKNGGCYVPCNPSTCSGSEPVGDILVEEFCDGDQCCSWDSLTQDKSCY